MNYPYVNAQSSGAMHCGQMKMKMLTLASGLIASVLVFSFMLKVPQVHAQTSCDYYASPNGTGNGVSPSTPFQISKFLSVATPGKTLCLLDGTYASLWVPDTFAGTASQPITIRALNDGKVLFDGGTSRAVDLQGSYGILEGVNARGGDNAGIKFRGDHWIGRRIVLWNDSSQPPLNGLLVMAGTNNTIEDCAVFGLARKTVEAGADGGIGGNIVRRCWASFEGLPTPFADDAPTEVYEVGYGQSNVTLENVIGLYDLAPGARAGVPEAPISIFRTQNSRVIGSIIYEHANANFPTSLLVGAIGDAGTGSGAGHDTNNLLIKDIVTYVSPSNPRFRQTSAFDLSSASGTTNTAINLVGVSGAGSRCGSGFSCSGLRAGTSLSEAIGAGNSIWNEVPGICKRYVNGVLTTTPLWPWPMNQRIKDALVQSGRAPVDVTQTMEGIFGPIPQACTTGALLPAETPAPRNLHVIGSK